MKYPKEIDRVTLIAPEEGAYFPPNGFVEFEEGNDGAGDYYGLYWEFGKEDQEPIVCEKRHEEWSLHPSFVNLSQFLDSYDNETGEFDYLPDFYDQNFFLANFNRGKVKARKSPIEAKELLIRSVEQFQEYSSSWALLSTLTVNPNERELMEKAAIKSFVSNWLFEIPTQKSYDHLLTIDFKSEHKHDALVNSIAELNFQSGFKGFNINYDVLYRLAQEYRKSGDHKSYLLMLQNFAFVADSVNPDERKKRGFDNKQWKNELLDGIDNYFPRRKFSSQSSRQT